MWIFVSTDDSHTVQVCDIVAVFKAKDGEQVSRSSQKKVSQLYPHGFTGTKPKLTRMKQAQINWVAPRRRKEQRSKV